jgi:drug/metabolite transporter (DMT)-like permease
VDRSQQRTALRRRGLTAQAAAAARIVSAADRCDQQSSRTLRENPNLAAPPRWQGEVMPTRTQRAGAAMMVGATLGWGICGAVSTTFRSQPVGLLAISSLVQALVLLGAVRLLGLSRARPRLRTVVQVALLDAGVMVSYITALTWAPAGPVAAVHLTAPVLLLGWAVLRGERRAGIRELGIAVLLLGGVGATAVSISGGGGRHPVAGILFAALSAVLYAMLLRVGSNLGSIGVAYTTGLKAALMALICAPSLLVFAMRPVDIGVNVGLLAVYVPASLLFWRAVTRTSATLIGSIGLLEAVFCGLFAWLLFSSPLRLAHIVAVALILSAVMLELRRAGRPLAEPLPLPGRQDEAFARSAA